MSRFLVTGASGLLGKSVIRALSSEGATVGIRLRSQDDRNQVVDVTSTDQVGKFFASHSFDVCVHCAADPNIKSCEDDPQHARLLNVEGARNIVVACARHNVRLVHISTDYIFAGTQQGGYGEDDPPSPLQVYGKTKAQAEKIVREYPNTLILRMPILYGYNDPGDKPTWPVETAMKLKAGKEVLADDTETRQPTLIDDVAEIIGKLVKQRVTGIIHVAPDQGTTKLEWGKAIAGLLGVADTAVIKAPSGTGGPLRPISSWLKNERLKSLGIKTPRGFRDGTIYTLRKAGYLS